VKDVILSHATWMVFECGSWTRQVQGDISRRTEQCKEDPTVSPRSVYRNVDMVAARIALTYLTSRPYIITVSSLAVAWINIGSPVTSFSEAGLPQTDSLSSQWLAQIAICKYPHTPMFKSRQFFCSFAASHRGPIGEATLSWRSQKWHTLFQ